MVLAICALGLLAAAGCFPEAPGQCSTDRECTQVGTRCSKAGVCVLIPDAGPDLDAGPPPECEPPCALTQVCERHACWPLGNITLHVQGLGDGQPVRGVVGLELYYENTDIPKGVSGPAPLPALQAVLVEADTTTELPATLKGGTSGIWLASLDTTLLADGEIHLGARGSYAGRTIEHPPFFHLSVDNTPPVIRPQSVGKKVYLSTETFRVGATLEEAHPDLVRARVDGVTELVTQESQQDGREASTEVALSPAGGSIWTSAPLTVTRLKFYPSAAIAFRARISARDVLGNEASTEYAIPITRVRWSSPVAARVRSAPVVIESDGNAYVIAGGEDAGSTPVVVSVTAANVARWSTTGPAGAGLSAAIVAEAGDRFWVLYADGRLRTYRDTMNHADTECSFSTGSRAEGSPALIVSVLGADSWVVLASADTRSYVAERLAVGCGGVFAGQSEAPSSAEVSYGNFLGTSPAVGLPSIGVYPLFFSANPGSSAALWVHSLNPAARAWSNAVAYQESQGGAPTIQSSPSLADSETDPMAIAYLSMKSGSQSTIRAVGQDQELKSSWSIAAESRHEPVIDHQRTVYAAAGAKLYALGPSGAVKWSTILPAAISAPPVLGKGGRIYVPAGDGKIHALDAQGNRIWSQAVSGAPLAGAPTLDCAGNLYAGADDGKLYSLATESRGLWPGAYWPKARHDPRNTGNAGTAIPSCP